MGINDLAGFAATAPTSDWENYTEASGGGSFSLPPEGRYLMRAKTPITLKLEAEGGDVKPTKEGGNAGVRIDPTFLSGPAQGKQLTYIRVYTSTFKRGESEVSGAGDFLKAVGYQGKPANRGQLVEAVAAMAGKDFTADLKWEASCFDCGVKVQKEVDFPVDEKGERQQKIACKCKDKVNWARANLFFVPKSKV